MQLSAARGAHTDRKDCPRASTRLWDLDWDAELPWTLDGVGVHAGSIEDALPFMQAHYAAIFGDQSRERRFFAEAMTPAKMRFLSDSDVFLFRDGETLVGILVANPEDWSTYYMRSVAVLPEYRDRKLLTGFMEQSYGALRRVGVERITGECAPANRPMMRMLVQQGFLVTSTASSERWGLTVRFTKFLRDEPEEVFLRQHCVVPKFEKRERASEERSQS